MAVLKFGYKRGREFARRMACYEGEYTPNHPAFAATSAAACAAGAQPVPADASPLVYTAEDDAVIEAFVRENGAFVKFAIRDQES